MEKIKKFILERLHWFIVGGTALLCAIFLIAGHTSESGKYVTFDGSDAQISESTKEFIQEAKEAIIDYANESVPTIITDGNGEEETIEAPTVESVDGGEILNEENCPDGEECGQGAFIYAPTDTFEDFRNYTYGKCWNVDGYAGSQCWDLASLHSINYTKDKRVFSTCGTHAARGMWDCKEQNAGTEYDLVYDVYKTHVGDIAVWNGGTWGHTCFIAGPVINGYVACYGENQGGSACPGGGAAANIINLSINNFRGAFHPKTYVEPEPEPEPEPSPTPSPTPVPVSKSCTSWTLSKGDTLGAIMKACEGSVTWGEAMNSYAQQWVDEETGKTVFTGWTTGTGVGLYVGHTIVKK